MTRSDSLFIVLVIVLGLALSGSGWIVAQSDGNGVKKPLDLPSGGKGDDEDEEDAPESISFYGGEYEGDGFFWCLDKSCSMGWADDIGHLKTEMSAAINSLSENAEFSIVAFSSGYIIFSPFPKTANAANRALGTAWVMALTTDGNTCLAPAGVETVGISNLCQKESKQIIVLSDGLPNCPGPAETTAAITGANWQHTPVNTIYIASDSDGITFMQSLAAANNGTFYQPPG